jgi:glycylpeptide N-tetradecanoyltransferase
MIENLNKRSLYTSDKPINVASLEWKTVDFNDKDELESTTSFINEHYVDDESERFTLKYTPEFIKWSLAPNVTRAELLVLKYNDKILGTVAYTVKHMKVGNTDKDFGEVTFLCVHPKYRTAQQPKNKKQQMVHLLIDEAIRRIVKGGATLGVFTTSKYIPTPSAAIRYFHRPLNYRKLFKHQFTILDGDTDKIHERFVDHVAPYDYYHNASVEDMDKIFDLYNEYNKRHNLYVQYTKEQLQHYLFNDHVKVYVMKNKEGEVIDFVSYYLLSQSVKDSDDVIDGAYLFLYTVLREDINLLGSNLIRLVSRDTKCDVLTVTDVMQNSDFLLANKKHPDEDSDQEDYEKTYDFKFIKGSGKLYLNFFNWACPPLYPHQISWISL